MRVVYVSPEHIDEVWGKCRPKILKAMSRGAGQHYTEDFYKKKVQNKEMLLIAAIESDVVACGVISVQEYPNHKGVYIELLAGERLDEWITHVEDFLRRYRDQIGATTIEASCRPGLVARLTNWRQSAVLMELK